MFCNYFMERRIEQVGGWESNTSQELMNYQIMYLHDLRSKASLNIIETCIQDNISGMNCTRLRKDGRDPSLKPSFFDGWSMILVSSICQRINKMKIAGQKETKDKKLGQLLEALTICSWNPKLRKRCASTINVFIHNRSISEGIRFAGGPTSGWTNLGSAETSTAYGA